MTEKTALEKFYEFGGNEEPDPLERLRFFCSLAIKGQDWLDVEQFFDDVKTMMPNVKLRGAAQLRRPARTQGWASRTPYNLTNYKIL